MATRKRTVITEETHEVWIIRTGDDEGFVPEPFEETQSDSAEVDNTLALKPIDDEA